MTCQCCNDEPSVGVAAIPGIPVSISWGRKCLEAGVIPYHFLVINTALAGGVDHIAPWWGEVIHNTITYFNVPWMEFISDVETEIEKQEADERELAEMEGRNETTGGG